MHSLAACALLLLLLPAQQRAAPDAAEGPSRATPSPGASPEIDEQLAFAAVAERMTVPVSIADAGPFPFIIDTGAQRTVISRELASTLGLSPGRDVRLTAMTGISTARTVVIPAVRVGTLGSTRIEAPALEARNLGAPGMLGLDSLQGHALAIDFERRVMAVTSAQRRPARATGEPGEIVVRAKSLLGQLVVTDAFYNNMRVRVVLDTGSAVSIGNDALRRRVAKRGALREPVVLTSVTGDTLTAPYTSIGQVRLGGATIDRLPIAFSEVPPFRQLGLSDRPAILLGMDALQLFRRIDIDFANHRIRLLAPRDARSRLESQVPVRINP